jgi:NHLM bacteriocin system ABC transporter peptidase/ATP-binding protein
MATARVGAPRKTTAPTATAPRAKTPTFLQMEAVECGAAALGIVLSYYGRYVPLEELRLACGVSRDGSKASNMAKAARRYGLMAQGYRKELDALPAMGFPLIVYWNFNHFVVVEGIRKDKVYLNDPASGPRVVSVEEFDLGFTGVVLECRPGPEFQKGGRKPSLLAGLVRRLAGCKVAVVYLMLAGLAAVLIGMIIPAFSRVFVDKVLGGGQDWIIPLLIGMGIAAALRATVNWLQQYFLLRLEARLAAGMSGRFFWHVLRLPVEFYTQRYVGEISSRVGVNDRLAQLMAGPLANTLLNVLLIAFYAVLMWQYDPLLTIVGVAIATSNAALLRYVSRRRNDESQRLVRDQGKLLATTIGGLQTMETIKATGGGTDFFARWAGFHAKVLNAQQQLGAMSSWLTATPLLLNGLSTAAILTLGGMRVMEGTLTAGTLVAFQSLMSSFLTPVNQMMNLGSTLQTVEGDVNRLDDVYRYGIDPQVEPREAETVLTVTRLTGALELRGLTFGYSRLAEPLIRGLDITLQSGDRVALVGGSGSGKSTVARLVAGLYAPWEGEVLFDGLRREQIPRRVMNSSLAFVDQDIFLFEGSVRENVSLWDPIVPEADIVQAAKDAAIHDDVVSRNGGYHHVIAEGGQNFSGGQRQRLEIARALAGNPTLLILDEATSALDPITEQAIDGALRRRGCTCLIVAHRLSTIRDCDEIIVLDGGKVVQRGTHDAMIKVEGPYATLLRSEEYQKPRRAAVLDRL